MTRWSLTVSRSPSAEPPPGVGPIKCKILAYKLNFHSCISVLTYLPLVRVPVVWSAQLSWTNVGGTSSLLLQSVGLYTAPCFGDDQVVPTLTSRWDARVGFCESFILVNKKWGSNSSMWFQVKHFKSFISSSNGNYRLYLPVQVLQSEAIVISQIKPCELVNFRRMETVAIVLPVYSHSFLLFFF